MNVSVSGRLDDSVAAEFKTLGVVNRLDKPFTEAQLANALKDLLSGQALDSTKTIHLTPN